MIANYAGVEVRPGSMGRALPGVTVAVLQRDADGARRAHGIGRRGTPRGTPQLDATAGTPPVAMDAANAAFARWFNGNGTARRRVGVAALGE